MPLEFIYREVNLIDQSREDIHLNIFAEFLKEKPNIESFSGNLCCRSPRISAEKFILMRGVYRAFDIFILSP